MCGLVIALVALTRSGSAPSQDWTRTKSYLWNCMTIVNVRTVGDVCDCFNVVRIAHVTRLRVSRSWERGQDWFVSFILARIHLKASVVALYRFSWFALCVWYVTIPGIKSLPQRNARLSWYIAIIRLSWYIAPSQLVKGANLNVHELLRRRIRSDVTLHHWIPYSDIYMSSHSILPSFATGASYAFLCERCSWLINLAPISFVMEPHRPTVNF